MSDLIDQYTKSGLIPNHKPELIVEAQWTVELNCGCPKCGEWVNVLDYPDFWDHRILDIPEHDTENSNAVDVCCPECHHEFVIKCNW